eukprot:581493-Hanusia_phi.AAC.1
MRKSSTRPRPRLETRRGGGRRDTEQRDESGKGRSMLKLRQMNDDWFWLYAGAWCSQQKGVESDVSKKVSKRNRKGFHCQQRSDAGPPLPDVVIETLPEVEREVRSSLPRFSSLCRIASSFPMTCLRPSSLAVNWLLVRHWVNFHFDERHGEEMDSRVYADAQQALVILCSPSLPPTRTACSPTTSVTYLWPQPRHP